MTERSFYWIDAFTDQPMGGNPCAVVFDAAGVPEEKRIAFTRETGLVESAFMVGSSKADFGARYYLQTGEIRMAGHPTIAVCKALDAASLLGERTSFTIEVGAGVVDIAVDRSGAAPLFTMTQYAPEFGRDYDPAEIATLVGLEPGDVEGRPQTVSTGGPQFCVTLLRGRDALARAALNHDLIAEQAGRLDFWEPFLCTLQGFTETGDTAARLMLPPDGPPEDPFTGSATGCMAAYLWRHGLIDSPAFTAEQGHGMGRPGFARVEVLGPSDSIEGVRVGGYGVVLMKGTVTL